MKLNKLVKLIYVALTFYALFVIDITTLTFIDLMPAIILMWIMYFLFSLPSRTMNSKIKKSDCGFRQYKVFDNIFFIGTMIILLFISLKFVVKFYVGLDMVTFIKLFVGKEYNFYQGYQAHHKSANISVFTIRKIPFILMLFFIKAVLVVSVIEFFVLRKKRNKKGYLLVFSSIVAHLMFGFARGTNFEIFELLLLFLFVAVKNTNNRKIKFSKVHFLLLLLVSFGAFAFYSRIKVRTGSLSFLKRHEYQISKTSILVTLFGENVTGILFFYDYFMFGFYYTSRFITEVVFASFENLFLTLLPNGLFLGKSLNIKNLMAVIAPRNTRWNPNIVHFTTKIGFLLVIIYVSILGIFNSKYNKNNLFSNVLAYLVLLQMFTLPIGNLLYISSANTLLLLFSTSILIGKNIMKRL